MGKNIVCCYIVLSTSLNDGTTLLDLRNFLLNSCENAF